MTARGVARDPVGVHLLLAAATLLFVLPSLRHGLMYYDLGELFFFTDALRQGRAPGLDFAVTAYGPGRYVLLGLLFDLFGRSLGTVWGLLLALRLATTALSWSLARRLLPPAVAWIPVLCLLVAPGPLHKAFFQVGSLALALQLVRATERPDRRRLLELGCVIALAAWFRLDLGAFGVLAALALCGPGPARLRDLPFALAPLILGLAGAAALLVLRWPGALPLVLGQLASHIAPPAVIPYPSAPSPLDALRLRSLDPVLIWAPVPVYAGMVIQLLRRRGAPSPQDAALWLLVLIGVLTCNQIRIKPEAGRVLQAGPLLWLVLTVAVTGAAATATRWRRAIALSLLPVALAAWIQLEHRGDLYVGSWTIGHGRDQLLRTAVGTARLNLGEYEELAPLLDALAAQPAGPLWVAGDQPLLHALSGRQNVTGFATTLYLAGSPARERALLDRLDAHPPVVAVVGDSDGPQRQGLLGRVAPRAQQRLSEDFPRVLGRWGRFRLLAR